MEKKRVCIVTNYSTTTNFGALLQAYALNKTISNLGYSPEDLYITGEFKSRKNKIIQLIRNCEFKKIWNECVGHYQKFRARKHLKERKKAMDSFRYSIPHTEKYSKDNLHRLQDEYNVFICGSDQIFRPSRLTNELEDYYFLSMVTNGSIKASYAASIGIDKYDAVTERKVTEYLSSFNYLSIREPASAKYLEKITGRDDIIVSIDPVFLIDREEWLRDSHAYNINGKYILVYMIHGTEQLYKSIKVFSQKLKCQIVTFPSMSYKIKSYEKNFGDIEILDADPLHFINLINNAEYVFTDSFHGTAFSLIMHKEAFVSKANQKAFSRIQNILALFHAENLTIPANGLDVDDYMKKRIVDWDFVDKTIKEQQDCSIRYLKNVIES